MLPFCAAGDQDAVNIANDLRNSLQDSVHRTLEHSRSGSYSEQQPGEPVKPLMCVDSYQVLGILLPLHLLVGLFQVQLGKLLPSNQSVMALAMGTGQLASLDLW